MLTGALTSHVKAISFPDFFKFYFYYRRSNATLVLGSIFKVAGQGVFGVYFFFLFSFYAECLYWAFRCVGIDKSPAGVDPAQRRIYRPFVDCCLFFFFVSRFTLQMKSNCVIKSAFFILFFKAIILNDDRFTPFGLSCYFDGRENVKLKKKLIIFWMTMSL